MRNTIYSKLSKENLKGDFIFSNGKNVRARSRRRLEKDKHVFEAELIKQV